MKAHETVDDPTRERRRLAANVVCMFSDDRAPIVNKRRHGPLPRCIPSIWRWSVIREGDLAVLIGGKNAGKRVRVLKFASEFGWEHGKPFEIESLDGPMWVGGREGAPLNQSTAGIVGANCMRKLSSGGWRL